MSKKYEQLRTLVYKIIYPDGVPLEFGCEIKEPTTKKNQTLRYVGYDNKQHCVAVQEKMSKPYADIHFLLMADKIKEGQNVGKPLSLQDILRAMKGVSLISYMLVGSDELDIHTHGDNLENDLLARINLSKPISEQDDSVLQSLIDLLT